MNRKSKAKTKRRKWIGYAAVALVLVAGLVWVYAGSLVFVEKRSIAVYRSLKENLAEKGYQPRMFVISGRRYWLDNKLLAAFGGASRNSRHLQGDAIDIVVLDINDDGLADAKDVDVVYRILDRELVRNLGGIGTYKSESGLLNRQMVHFDLRGHRARWHR